MYMWSIQNFFKKKHRKIQNIIRIKIISINLTLEKTTYRNQISSD